MTRRDDAQTYTPPKSVQANAARAQRWIQEGRAGDGFTATGARRAALLAAGEPVSLDTVKRINSYLKRHISDTRAKGFDGDEEGYPSPGRVAWDAWGGNDALPWTESILEEIARAAAKDAARSDSHPPSPIDLRPAPVRLDSGEGLDPRARAILRPPERLPDGAWRVDALAAWGDEVKSYPWGAEVVPWDELVETVGLFEGLPVTIHHPPQGEVTPTNGAQTFDGARVLGARLDQSARALVLSLALPHLPPAAGVSVGWSAGWIDKSSTPPAQRDLTPNHLAITPTPRVESAGMRLDAQPSGAAREGVQMAKVQVAGKEYEVPDEVKAEMDKLMADKAAMRAEMELMRDDAEKAKGASEAMQAARMDAKRADEVKAQARELAHLWSEAAPYLGDADRARLDSLSVDDVRRAVLAKLTPTLDLKDRSAQYIEGAYRLALDTAKRADSNADNQAARLDSRQPAAPPASVFGRAFNSHLQPKKGA